MGGHDDGSGIFNIAKNKLEASFLEEFIKGGAFGALGGGVFKASLGWWSGVPLRNSYGNIFRGSALYGGLFGTYIGVQCLSAQVRQKDDIFNAPISGFFTGLLIGMNGKHISS
ncbi:hypothetical protein HDU97_009948 [Phlyctochytrium planicorne]|nr:hypothetical protein HDU97_009948 [Phlyctochytrium planicorne]